MIFHFHRTVFLAELGEALARSGEVEEGLAVVDQALERARRHEEGWCLPELLRKKGELSILHAPTAAEDHFRQALDMARQQNALSWELRSATSLARLYHRQRRRAQARNVLAPIYGRFTEGFKTADLLTAKALLAEFRSPLSGPPGGT